MLEPAAGQHIVVVDVQNRIGILALNGRRFFFGEVTPEHLIVLRILFTVFCIVFVTGGMVYELEQAGKQFDMRLYPGQRHGVRGRTLTVNLYEMMTRFLHRALLESAGDDLAVSVSHTTRASRPGEVDGKDYHFVDVET